MDMKDYYNKHRLNGIYNYIMKNLKPKRIIEDNITI